MLEMKMTEVELLGLLGISLWDNGVEALSAETKIRAQEARNVLLKELYTYCLSVDQKNAPT
ncbi:unnamed protein product, partial [Enterobius vermicularis]|uniref:NR LBD domain-containing protein n=1 Tax=Enterobius vermicularis TaxID=51028 RepID=A0A0N4VPY3_ENTVE